MSARLLETLGRCAAHPAAWLAPVAVAAVLLLAGIDEHPFWGDEADTALFGRSILLAGYPTAWDGRNLYAHRYGAQLNAGLTEVQLPWAQYYLAAAGFALWGETTRGGRLPFALLGLLTVAAFYWLVLRFDESRRFAFGCAAALSLWVPFLLFAPQCRYFAPAMLAAVVLAGLWLDLSLRRYGRFGLFVLTAAFFFHTQYLMFASWFAALLLADLVLERRRERLRALLVSIPFILLLTLPWVILLEPYRDPIGRVLANARPDRWLRLVLLHFRDYNHAGFFPALLLVPLGLYGAQARQRGDSERMALPLVLVVAFTLGTAFLSPQLGFGDADVRYAVAAIPFLVLTIAQCLRWLWRQRPALALAVAVLCFGTDLLSAGFLRPGYQEEIRTASPFRLPFRSYLAEYLHELGHHYTTAHEAVIGYLDRWAGHDDTVVMYPRYMGDPSLFYLGGRLRFVSVLPPDGGRLAAVAGRLPADLCGPVQPDWLVGFGQADLEQAVRELGIAADDYQTLVLDQYARHTSRPEIIWRTFGPKNVYRPEERIFILRRLR